ncbi:glycoside hydrolase superfamily [Aspergillus pseudoustus]|uniref:Glycoside hydrolase superfamily n=1 Tax=Aspergillus pseudoustus TaxID=1810923 RepID=A0ABR4J0G6_9EURO
MPALFQLLGNYSILSIAILSLPARCAEAAAVTNTYVGSSNNRVRLHDGWKFWRSEEIPDKIVYDLRSDADDDGLSILKNWILPTANEFIINPDNHHERPSGQPDLDIDYVKRSYDDTDWGNITVPHDWAVELGFLDDDDIIPRSMGQLPVHGVGYYRRTLQISRKDLGEKTIFLEFDGAMSYPMVWVNEQLVGGWVYGYTSFRLDITKYLNTGDNYLAVRVENPRGAFERWYTGAGLYRNVWLAKVDNTHVQRWGTIVTTRDVSTRTATIDLSVQVDNKRAAKVDATVATHVYELEPETGRQGRRVASFPRRTITIGSSETAQVNGSVRIRNPRLWGPPPSQSPHMYLAITQIWQGKSLVDSYETRFGVRSLTYDSNNGLLVNNQPVRIQGVNQHHDLGALGAAFNKRAATRQLEMLQELGTNAIRMAHNPPAPELLDLCDQMGFLIINEIFDCWKEGKRDLDYHLLFNDWHEPDLRALIRRDRNHPSVFAWSYGNEVIEQTDDDAGSEISYTLRAIVHEEDPTRLGTFSMDKATPASELASTADLISLNYQGEGMRYGPAYAHLTSGTRKTPQYGPFHQAYPDKLILGSEVASSLSLRGSFVFPVTRYNSAPVNNTSGADARTSAVSAYELYTAEAGSSADRVFLTQDENEFVAGGFVWTGWDYIGEPYWCRSCRSGYWGIIDLAGFKKERFWLYQARWRPNLPMAHIVPHWNWPDRRGKVTPVHVFTSGDEAELFINGNSQGRFKRQEFEYRFRWDNVTYEPGEVRVMTYKDGKQWAEHTVQTASNATSLRLSADRSQILSDGEDLSFITVEIVDSDGLIVPTADNEIKFSISGPGKLLATDNGFPADYASFTSSERKAFNGLCLGIVSALSGNSGKITVKVESNGLESGEIQLVAV